jgi:phosphatidylglycerol---prolipoprotein diacylglyceryl transferase
VAFPVYIWIGPLQIHPHFLFEALAYAIAFRLVLRGVRRDAIPLSQRTSVIVGGMVGALVGAKLLVLVQHIDLLWQHWHQLLWLLVQGKTVVGALLGGLIGVELTKKWIGVTQSTGDVFVYPLIVGTVIGRIGCFLTGLSDHTYGTATTLPWGVNFGDGVARHPTQLYEIIFLIGLLLILKLREKHLRKNGDRFKVFLMAYLSFRFLIDFIKPEFRPLLGLSAIQIASLLGILYYRHDLKRLIQMKHRHYIS